MRKLTGSVRGRLSLALLLGGMGAVTLTQASLNRVESNVEALQDFHSPALHSVEDIRAKMGEAIQEGFAYVISGSEEEKQEFQAWADGFGDSARDFHRIARLDQHEEAEERALFREITVLQVELVERAQAMFEEYEARGEVTSETFERYEVVIDQVLKALDEFVAIERGEVAELYADSFGRSVD